MPHGKGFVQEEDSNSWTAYRIAVTQGLDNLDGEVDRLNEKVDKRFSDLKDQLNDKFNELNSLINKIKLEHSNQITSLNTKAGLLGSLGGTIFGIMVNILWKAVKGN